MSEYNGQTTRDGHRCAVLQESVTVQRRCALGPTTMTVVDMACHFAVTVLFKNAIGCSEHVVLATDTTRCIQSTGRIIQTGREKYWGGGWFQCHFVHHRSDMNWHWTEAKPLD